MADEHLSRGEDALRRLTSAGSGIVAAAAGLVLAGPAGAVVGAALPGTMTVGLDLLLERRAQVRRRAAEEMLALSIEAADVAPEDFVGLIEASLATERLTSTAIEAATEASYAEKLAAIARSLARGLSSQGRPDVDREILVIEALRAMEPVHVWLLDRLVQWQPLTSSLLDGTSGPHGEAIALGPTFTEDGEIGRRQPWTRSELAASFNRHQNHAVFEPALGALLRHGLTVEDATGPLRAISSNSAFPLRYEDVQVKVQPTVFGLEVHALLLSSGALQEVERGDLDVKAEARGARGLPAWAKLAPHAAALGISAAMAEAADARASSEGHHGGYWLPTNPVDPSMDEGAERPPDGGG